MPIPLICLSVSCPWALRCWCYSDGNEYRWITQLRIFRIVPVFEQAIVLDSTSDSDGDGISDEEEGISTDNDGIPDFLDNSAVSNEIPLGEESVNVVKTANGLTVALGQMAKLLKVSANGIAISLDELKSSGGENGSATEVVAELNLPDFNGDGLWNKEFT